MTTFEYGRNLFARGIGIGLCTLLCLATVPAALAADGQPAIVEFGDQIVATDAVPLVAAPGPNRASLAAEDAEREILGLPPRFAVPNEVTISPETHGTWETLDGDRSVWRLRVGSPGAYSLNLGFGSYFMPRDGQLLIYSSDLKQMIRPFTAEDNASHGELWTPVLIVDELVVEVTVPRKLRKNLRLELDSINVGYRDFGDPVVRSGSCNIDVVCPQGNNWSDEIPSVAAYSTGGSIFCTGAMINNTAQDETPYFLTANHCGIGSGNAASLVVYWNFETSSCGGNPNGQLTDFQTGAFFRASYSTSDVTLLELDSNPDSAWGVTYAGWDRSGSNASAAIAIHHPSGDEKRISFENQSTSTTTYLGSSVPGNGTHVRVTDWDEGTTEPGSSGSPLFDQNHRIIGQLHGGYAACGNNDSDWYGKFSVSWTGGGSNSTRLSNWLDPGNTGAATLNTLVPGGCTNNNDCDDGLYCNGAETCNVDTCQAGSNPCQAGEVCNEGNDTCEIPVCDADGTCESGEDCNNCGSDCIGASGASCGNGICEPGEDCASCAADCRGRVNGNPSRRYCCSGDAGGAGGPNPIDCTDSRCTQDAWECSFTAGAYCCGDGTCEGAEDAVSCAIDCAVTCGNDAECGDGVSCTDDTCDGGTCVNTPNDGNCPNDGLFCNGTEGNCTATGCVSSGDPCGSGETCNESTDQCDSCGARNSSCSQNSDCCSNRCKNNGRCR